MRVVRIDDTFAEIRIGGASWLIRFDQWDAASRFLEHVRYLWDMRVVWADEGTPVDGDCAKRLLDENERLRKALQRAFEDMHHARESMHVAQMRVLHAMEPKKHGPVPDAVDLTDSKAVETFVDFDTVGVTLSSSGDNPGGSPPKTGRF